MKNWVNKKKGRGFTLVELLVVIAVIALLLSILIPALRRAKDQALRTSCGGNIRQLLMGLIMYADGNNQQLPRTGGYWPWDGEYDVVNAVLKNMGTDPDKMGLRPDEDVPIQDVFYCPANIQRNRNKEQYWGFAVNPANQSGYRVLGYGFLWAAYWNGNGNDDIMGDGNKFFVKRMDVRNSSSVELIIDVVIRQGDSFSIITVGGMPNLGSPDSTNHLVSETKAAGGNIGFVDGSVVWRPFTEMQERYRAGPMWYW